MLTSLLHATPEPLYSLMTPQGEAKAYYGDTIIDATGDVLVTGEPNPTRGFHFFGPPATSMVGQLKNASSSHATSAIRRLPFRWAHTPASRAAKARRNASTSWTSATSTTRTVVAFSGSARLEGFGLGGNALAWSQQSYAYQFSGEQAYTCVGLFAIGHTELTEVPLSASGPPITVNASPEPLRPDGSALPPP